LAAPEWFFSSQVSTSLTKFLVLFLFLSHTLAFILRSQFHFSIKFERHNSTKGHNSIQWVFGDVTPV